MQPKLTSLDGQKTPEELLRGERFAFITGVPRLLGSPYTFRRYGQSGASVSNLLPHLQVMTSSKIRTTPCCVVKARNSSRYSGIVGVVPAWPPTPPAGRDNQPDLRYFKAACRTHSERGHLDDIQDASVAITVVGAFLNDEGKMTVVPMVHTVGTFFYRTDLVKENEVPKTWAELVTVSKRLQDQGKAKWGYVGGMKMNHTWFTLWWAMWSNKCDIFYPIYERNNDVLAKNGWKPAIADPCHREVVEFWWDAMNTHKISPKAMPSYGRDEANAIFMAGDAAFTLVDSTHFGSFNDPKKSKVVGKVGMAKFPMGPRRDKPFAWNEIWGWAIPKGVPAERKALAKQALQAMLTDEAGQVEMWKTTGGPPPSLPVWKKIAATDPVFNKLKEVVFDQEQSTHAAYYFAEWPAVHKAYSDVVIKAITGSREDIPKVLSEGVKLIHDAVAK